jgi:3',5'-cyclic AMP phosphodiesterase CpdA
MSTILHISDLHRSPEEPLSNAALIASLLLDRDRFALETPSGLVLDAIVVSGDIVQGARLGSQGWDEEVQSQYDVAYEFLAELTERMVDGDRSRPRSQESCRIS